MLYLSIFDIRSTSQDIFQVIQVEAIHFHRSISQLLSFGPPVVSIRPGDSARIYYLLQWYTCFDGFIIGPHSYIFRFHFSGRDQPRYVDVKVKRKMQL